MKLPRRELLEGSRRREELEPLVAAAERALRTWEPVWTPFLDAALREEAVERLSGLSELAVAEEGGHAGAERRRLLLQPAEAAREPAEVPTGLTGLEIAGNFLFDPAAAAEFRQALLVAGAEPGEVGDLWLRGDRGAQGIVTAPLAARLADRRGRVRTVAVEFAARPVEELQLPVARIPRPLVTVEASLRLDAVASAGFGLSRNRMAEMIRRGAVRIDWQPVTSPSRELAAGERVQLEGRGELAIETIERTRRDRFRIRMERR
ncbi:MAG: photosystem II S4 domain protein [Synechococcaceae cyanobacterium]|nr:photosystem II S4 domain protein [Synechococcaceae cyanobacterium]